MIWAHSGRMHWTSHDMPGRMLDVLMVKGTWLFRLIDAETGEVITTQEFNHPVEAMKHGKKLLDHEVAHATYQKISEEAKSKSTSPAPETTCTIQEGNRLPC